MYHSVRAGFPLRTGSRFTPKGKQRLHFRRVVKGVAFHPSESTDNTIRRRSLGKVSGFPTCFTSVFSPESIFQVEFRIKWISVFQRGTGTVVADFCLNVFCGVIREFAPKWTDKLVLIAGREPDARDNRAEG